MWWFDTLVALVVVGQIVNFWLLSENIISYALMLGIYVGYIVVETTLAFNVPEQRAVLLFNIVNLWGLAMSTKGIIKHRLYKV